MNKSKTTVTIACLVLAAIATCFFYDQNSRYMAWKAAGDSLLQALCCSKTESEERQALKDLRYWVYTNRASVGLGAVATDADSGRELPGNVDVEAPPGNIRIKVTLYSGSRKLCEREFVPIAKAVLYGLYATDMGIPP